MADIVSTPWRKWPKGRRRPFAVRVHFTEVGGRRAWVGLELWGTQPPYVTVPFDGRRGVRRMTELAGSLKLHRQGDDGLELWSLIQDAESYFSAPGDLVGEHVSPLTSGTLRGLRQQDLVQEALDDARRHVRSRLAGPALSEEFVEREEAALAWLAAAPDYAKARPRHGVSHYKKVAKVYLAAQGRGDHPTAAVMHAFDVNKSTAAQWVAKCREEDLGLIPPSGGRGRATPRAEEGR